MGNGLKKAIAFAAAAVAIGLVIKEEVERQLREANEKKSTSEPVEKTNEIKEQHVDAENENQQLLEDVEEIVNSKEVCQQDNELENIEEILQQQEPINNEIQDEEINEDVQEESDNQQLIEDIETIVQETIEEQQVQEEETVVEEEAVEEEVIEQQPEITPIEIINQKAKTINGILASVEIASISSVEDDFEKIVDFDDEIQEEYQELEINKPVETSINSEIEEIKDIITSEEVEEDEAVEEINNLLDEMLEQQPVEEENDLQQVEETEDNQAELKFVNEVLDEFNEDKDIKQAETIEEDLSEIEELVSEICEEPELSQEEKEELLLEKYAQLGEKKILNIIKNVKIMCDNNEEATLNLIHFIAFESIEDKEKFLQADAIANYEIEVSENENEVCISAALANDQETILKAILELANNCLELNGRYRGWTIK